MNIKLDMNEIPYPPPKNVIKAAEKGLASLNRYASLEERELIKKQIAKYSGIPKKNIIAYPGSDLILREIVHIFSKERKVIMVYPTFFPTYYAAKQFGKEMTEISLEPPEFNLNTELLFNELNEPSLVIIDNPNNPTGKILLDKITVETILENTNSILVIDEAYYEFTNFSFVHFVKKYPNLAIGRTISKAFGLAGTRIGYIIGGEIFMDVFSSVSIMLPQVSLLAAIEALKNPEYIQKNIEITIKERERVKRELEEIGIQVYPSTTNFLLINTNLPDIGPQLIKYGILVFDLSNRWHSGFIRVTIGTEQENDIFLSTMKKILH
ncbi:MAG: pyridoxal phosphate-dependent aminotransferase [Promethearchaeota archaeon]